MDSLDQTTLKRGITLDVSTSDSSITHIYISSRGHLAFMQIKKVAQGYRLGNQAEFVPRPNMNTNQQKNSIVENISGSTIVHTSKEPVCPRVELILKIIIILLIIFLGFIKSKPC